MNFYTPKGSDGNLNCHMGQAGPQCPSVSELSSQNEALHHYCLEQKGHPEVVMLSTSVAWKPGVLGNKKQ